MISEMEPWKLRLWAHDRTCVAIGLQARGISFSVRLSRTEAADFWQTLVRAHESAIARTEHGLIRVTLRQGSTRFDVDMSEHNVNELMTDLGAYLRAMRQLATRGAGPRVHQRRRFTTSSMPPRGFKRFND
jgi:hypothetical protein